MAGLLLAALLSLCVGACGRGDELGFQDRGDTPSQPINITMATGTIATDDWGYTSIDPVQITAPAGSEVRAEGHTLLQKASHAVVSGPSATTVISSTDVTTLPSAAQSSAPGALVSYLSISIGEAKTALPALSVGVDAASLAAGTAVTVYRYDSVTAKWTAPQSTTVSSTGRIAFKGDQMAIYGMFR